MAIRSSTRLFYLNYFLFTFIVFSIIGCVTKTYRDTIPDVRNSITQKQYPNAIALIGQNKDYNRKANKLLYNLEMGKLYHSSKDYAKSNEFLNEADLYFDKWSHLRVLDIQGNYKLGNDKRTNGRLGTHFFGLRNLDYHPEDYEKILIHYYKALNYVYLQQTDEALVEAKRLEQLLYNMSAKDVFSDHSRIINDPFTQILIGLIYESGHNINDAFIAYRNASKMYKDEQQMPDFLKQDILRCAYLSGLDYETGLYENLFGMRADSIASLYARSMVILWENGMAPLKEEQDIIITYRGDKLLAPPYSTVVETSRGNFVADLFLGQEKTQKSIPGRLISIPKYVSTPSYYHTCKIACGDSNSALYTPVVVENIELLTTQFINERSMNEVDAYAYGATDTAQVSYGVRPDLRSWHSLPAEISYCRIPLSKSDTTVSLLLVNRKDETDTLTLVADAKQKFILHNIITYK
jgi:hypothetical protein